jgi:hypothetical protein
MELRAFINELEIMAVHLIKERLLRQNPMLIREMTLEDVFKRAVSRSAAELRKILCSWSIIRCPTRQADGKGERRYSFYSFLTSALDRGE